MPAPAPHDSSTMRVLVAVDVADADGSTDAAARQLQPLVDLAQPGGWPVHLVHVAPGGEAVPDRLASALEALAAELGEHGIDVEVELLQGPTVETILGRANDLDAGLVVVIGHKHSLARRVVLGSVAGAVVRQATRPVLVLPGEPIGPEAPLETEALTQLVEVIDRQDESGEALQELRDLAQAQLDSADAGGDDDDHSIGRQLRAALERFETDHPSLTRAINDVSYYLSGMGI